MNKQRVLTLNTLIKMKGYRTTWVDELVCKETGYKTFTKVRNGHLKIKKHQTVMGVAKVLGELLDMPIDEIISKIS